MKTILLAILVLVAAVSGYFIFLIAREVVVSHNAYRHFDVGKPSCNSSQTRCETQLTDIRRGIRYDATVERIAGSDHGALDTFRYRLSLQHGFDQPVVEDFTFAERASPRYRAMLAQYVTPVGLGFYSQANTYWPTVLYPLLFPLGTAVATSLALFVVIWGRFRSAR